ncbi:MAG: hypothetical protein ACI9FJ_002250 [Alteromonadaceae bacterium]|jgi:hypothetical protein
MTEPSQVQPPSDNQLDNQASTQCVHCRIEVELQWQPFEIHYQLYVDHVLKENGQRGYKDIAQQTPFDIPQPKKRIGIVGLILMRLNH